METARNIMILSIVLEIIVFQKVMLKSKLKTIERCYNQLKFIKITSIFESKKKKSYMQ